MACAAGMYSMHLELNLEIKGFAETDNTDNEYGFYINTDILY